MGKRSADDTQPDEKEAKRLKKERKAAKKAAEAAKAAEATTAGTELTAEELAAKKERKRIKKEKKAKAKAALVSDAVVPEEKKKKKEKKSKKEKKEKEESAATTEADVVQFESFDATPFDKKLVKALKAGGFTKPTPIQAQAWPIVLEGHDLIAVVPLLCLSFKVVLLTPPSQAKTGSGKTLGFLLPAFHMINNLNLNLSSGVPTPQALVVTPTRELANQIQAECEKFGKVLGCAAVCLYGGVPVNGQLALLTKIRPVMIIATPGRLKDMIDRKALSLSEHCSYVVLDEADRMLDMGFEPQVHLPSA